MILMQRLLFYHPIGNRPAFVKVTGHASSVMVNAYDKTAQEYNATKKESLGLDFSGSGRGHNTSVGTFEILEIEYDEDGKIVAFAANFVQQGSWYHQQPYSPPLLGCVRYNSSIPVEKTFLLDIHENQRFQDWDEY